MILYEQSVVWYVLGQLACLCSMAWQKLFPNLSEFLNQRNHSHSRITCSGVPLHAKHLSGFLSIPNLIMFRYVFWITVFWFDIFLGDLAGSFTQSGAASPFDGLLQLTGTKWLQRNAAAHFDHGP